MPKLRVGVLISGGGTNLQALLDACDSPKFPAKISIVISNKSDAYGLTRAQQAGVATKVISHSAYPSRDVFDAALHEALREAGVELVCLAGFMRILSEGFVKKWEGKMLNIHPSLLPKLKGLHTHERAIEAGEKTHGCTVHYVTAELDDGPIIAQAEVPVLDGDTPEVLAARVLEQEHQIYPAALKQIAEELTQKKAAD